jgi:hypothetical protein
MNRCSYLPVCAALSQGFGVYMSSTTEGLDVTASRWLAAALALGVCWQGARADCEDPITCWDMARAEDQGSDQALRLYGLACDGGVEDACFARAALEPDPSAAAAHYEALCARTDLKSRRDEACEGAQSARCDADLTACDAACASGDAARCWARARALEATSGMSAALPPLRRACDLLSARGCERAAFILSQATPDADAAAALDFARRALALHARACVASRQPRACDAALALSARFRLPSDLAVARAACALGVSFDCPSEPIE